MWKLVSIVGNTGRSIEYVSVLPRGQTPRCGRAFASSRVSWNKSWRNVAIADGLPYSLLVHDTTQRETLSLEALVAFQ